MGLYTYVLKHYPKSISSPWEGVEKGKALNLETARKNLITCCETLTKHDVNYKIVFGTLLGLYRDGDLIPHDLDMDIAIHEKDFNKLTKTIDDLVSNNEFKVVRVQGELLVSIGKDGDYIDFYIFRNGRCSEYTLSNTDFASKNTIDLLGNKLNTIDNPVAFFKKYYGGDWETPIKGLSAARRHTSRRKKNG